MGTNFTYTTNGQIQFQREENDLNTVLYSKTCHRERHKGRNLSLSGSMQAVLDSAPRRDLKIPVGDLNTKEGEGNAWKVNIIGKHGFGSRDDNGELFSDFCALNDYVIGGTLYHTRIHEVM